VAWALLSSEGMTHLRKCDPAVPALRYSNALRCIGQSIQSMDLKAVEIKLSGDKYVVQLWNRGTSLSMDLEKQFTIEDLERLDLGARPSGGQSGAPRNLLSLSHVLRLAGNYVDRAGGRLIRVCWQEQADKIQSVTIQYEPAGSERTGPPESPMTTIEELCIHVYKQRKKISAASERSGQRQAASVSAAG
jgi:hypothetical protein